MNEAIVNLTGKNIASSEGLEFSQRIMDFMRDRLKQYQLETDNIYNLEATPAEGTSYRLALKDKNKFSKIIVANEKEFQKGTAPFYTNSTQLPVNFTDDMFELLDLQDSLQIKYTGGTVVHLFVGERISDANIVKNLVKKICDNYHLPYFTITPTFSVCKTHGYIAGEHKICPKCKGSCEVYSRVVGYLRPVGQWNNGKRAEFKQRKKFKINYEH
jgi:ribonucleoside-triphosphate reductase